MVGHLASIFSKTSVFRGDVYENFLSEIPIQILNILRKKIQNCSS